MSKCIGCGCELITGDVNNLCNVCEGRPIINVPKIFPPAPGPFDKTFEPTYYAPWICPRCGTVHAPWVNRCNCPPPIITTSDIKIES